jgi:hypothetical protein
MNPIAWVDNRSLSFLTKNSTLDSLAEWKFDRMKIRPEDPVRIHVLVDPGVFDSGNGI